MQKKVYTLFLLLCSLISFRSLADDNGRALFAAVQKAHNSGVVFSEQDLFTKTPGVKHAVLKNETALLPVANNILKLYDTKPEAVSIKFTDHKGKEYKLEMLYAHPLAANANLGYINANGRHRAAFDAGLHYQGAVAGSDKSVATMSIFGDGTVAILFANEDGNFVVGKVEDGSGVYVLYNDEDMLERPNIPCGVSDEDYKKVTPKPQQKTTAPTMCHKVQIYWEVDSQLCQNKGGLVGAQTYMISLFNQFQALYRNENIAVELKSMYIWVTNDGYAGAGSGTSFDGLDAFQSFWNAQGDGFDGDLAHLITRDQSSNGGVAYLDVLCYRPNAYAYSEINGSLSGLPTYTWDVEVVTHETGHNLGSKHTHWCGWNTGAGGTCGSIDNCTTQEAGGGSCTTPCSKTFDNALPATSWRGTIMSYCHLVSRGIYLTNGFGPLPGGVIRGNVTSSTCLKSIISATLTSSKICTNDGSINLSFNADNFGVSPYTYSWSGPSGGTTQNLTNLSTGGTYFVTITDSNSCTNSLGVDVPKLARPGNGKNFPYTMPLCCKDTSYTMVVSADLPTDITSCQTVAWLKTDTAITSFAGAEAAFSAALPANILLSTNSNIVSNGVAATLNVASPVPCVKKGYYYTPFITRKIKPINTITASGSTNSAVTVASIQIGSEITLSNQMSSASACDLLDAPSAQSLSVTVSSYAGRAGWMQLLIRDVTDRVLYRQTGLPGNGTYNIPLSSIAGSPLQFMTISAVDYNCNTTTCIASSVTLNASRSVTYPAIPQTIFDSVCVVGTSTYLGFAPDSCTKLVDAIHTVKPGVTYVTLYPNPATNSVTLKFYADKAGIADLRITDLVGKTVQSMPLMYSAGYNEQPINLQGWAKGVYFFSLYGNEVSNTMKLVVE
jgi:hypothetical protein